MTSKAPVREPARKTGTPSTASDNPEARADLEVALPVHDELRPQDEEYFLYKRDGVEEWKQLRVHDYPELYSEPGLYEKIVYDVFGCSSPRKVAELLSRVFVRQGVAGKDLRALDLGCGNGCVGEELAAIGVREIVGIDLFPEAKSAAERDRPGLYTDFLIGDLLSLEGDQRKRFEERDYDLMTCVAALGFGDIPPEVFARALDRVKVGGWVGFTIKDMFLDAEDSSGFAKYLKKLLDEGVLDIREQETYIHRTSVNREPLDYVCLVARKTAELPPVN